MLDEAERLLTLVKLGICQWLGRKIDVAPNVIDYSDRCQHLLSHDLLALIGRSSMKYAVIQNQIIFNSGNIATGHVSALCLY